VVTLYRDEDIPLNGLLICSGAADHARGYVIRCNIYCEET
jgi:hypothetical protein